MSDNVLDIIRSLEREAGDREHMFVNRRGRPWGHTLLPRFYDICRRAGIDGAHSGVALTFTP